jgi:uncharacterized protein with GYD domain
MRFVTLARLRARPSKELLKMIDRAIKSPPKGVKIRDVFWTLGRYDMVMVHEAPDQKRGMSLGMQFGDHMTTETMAAVTRKEAIRSIEEAMGPRFDLEGSSSKGRTVSGTGTRNLRKSVDH